MNRKVRLGFIGCGRIAEAQMKACLLLPDVEIVAGCDLIPGKAAEAFARVGITGAKTDYKNDEEMLADASLALDAVSICTYNCEHAMPAIRALDKGLHVLLEKPFTVTLDEAVEVMRAEKRSGKIVSIGFQPRFDRNMQKIREIVESGTLGRIYYIQTGGGRRRGIPVLYGSSFIEKETAGVGALGDIGCYALDMVLAAIGYPRPLTVSGYTSDFFGKDKMYSGYTDENREEYVKKFGVDDFAAAFIRLEGGIILDFRISWAMNMDTSGDTLILGTKGGLRIPSTECWGGSTGGPMTIYHEVDGEQVETVVPEFPHDRDLFLSKISAFVDAIKTGEKAPIPTSEILYNQAILDAVIKSNRLGREVEVVIPEI